MPAVRSAQVAFSFADADPPPTIDELRQIQRVCDGQALQLMLAHVRGEMDGETMIALLGFSARAWTICENEIADIERRKGA